MTTTEHLTRTKIHREPEKRRREIHIHISQCGQDNKCNLRFPFAQLDAATVAEILRRRIGPAHSSLLPEAERARVHSREVAEGAEICERHGWRLDDVWRDERGELHVRMSKEDT